MNVKHRFSPKVLVMAVLASFNTTLFNYQVKTGMVMFESDADHGNTDAEKLNTISGLLTKQSEAFADFKKANDKKIGEIEAEGKASAETLKEVKTLSDTLADLTKELKAAQDRMDDIEKKGGRPGAAGAENEAELEHKKAFFGFMRTGDVKNLADLEAKALQSGSDIDGGYLVPIEVDASIDRVAATVSALGGLADVKTIGTESIKMRVKKSGVAARWVGDGEAGGETTNPKYATVTITAHELEAEPWAYNTVLEDAAFDLEMDVTDEAGIGFGEAEGVGFISGDGVKKPTGILAYPKVANANYEWGKVGFIVSGGASGFASTNPGDALISLQHSLKSVYRKGASFIMNDATLGKIRQMKDGSGNFYLFNPDATGEFAGFILGTPVEIDDNMPDVEAGTFPIAYGNWKRAYRVVNRKGTALIRDNITEKGTTKFNFRKRVGGGIKQFEALKLLKIAES